MLTLTDMFCGAGGSSTGAAAVPGVQVSTAMNHWPRAIETHARNHPSTDHVLADISQSDPRYIPRTDLLWASPECTNHSVAKGRRRATAQDELWGETLPDAAAERSRATMWDVPRFAEHHRYRSIIVENVVDAAKWVLFESWLHAMTALGYRHRIVYISSMHAQWRGLPAPQSRDRMYIVLWRAGGTAPDLEQIQRPPAWCPRCDRVVAAMQTWKRPDRPWGRYRAQYYYRCPNHACRGQMVEPGWLPAASIIDWSLPAERIGDRKRPLSPKTVTRIREGLRRYGSIWGPLIHRNYTPRGVGAGLTRPVSDPLGTVTAADHHSLIDFDHRALILEAAGNTYDAADPRHPSHGDPDGYYRIWPADDPLRTVHTTASKGLLIPVEGRDGKHAVSSDEPLRTQTTRSETGLLVPYYGTSTSAYPTDEPVGTLTAHDRYALVTLRGQNAPKPVTAPLDTITAGGNHAALAEVDVPDIEQCRFRMLHPDELKRAMAFTDEYVLLGTKREQVRQAGNSVPPPNARDIVWAVAELLGGAA